MRTRVFQILAVATLVVTHARAVIAAEPASLTHRVDELIEAALPEFSQHASTDCTDAEFLRRVSLDLTATIPSAHDTRHFLDDSRPSQLKRSERIDQLLASPAYARRMQYLLDWILMERRTSENIASAGWQTYLRQAAAENRPWDQLANEILVETGSEPKTRSRARFYLDRDFDLTVLTRDVGRIFLGKDLECAQCHDHPVVDAYLQRHYHGLKAFLNRSYLFTDPKSKKKSIGEKAEGVVTFTSVFDDTTGKTAPRILDLAEILDPKGTDKQYVTKPSKSARGIPKYSRREQLGLAVTSEQNRAFRLNIANRLWAAMMGRGLVEPLDFSHPDNPASHPQLLELLGDQLHDHAYDMKWFLGQLVRTRTYQRSSRPVDGSADIANTHFAVGLLKPLSPEQYAWATMQATGVLSAARTIARKQLEDQAAKQKAKSNKKPDGNKAKEPAKTSESSANNSTSAAPPPAALTISPQALEMAVDKALQGHVTTFVTQFASGGGQRTTFSATAPQALFLVNGELFRGWLKPSSTNLTGRLSKLNQPSDIAEESYIGILNRQPSVSEQAEVAEYLAAAEDRTEAIVELISALLLSAEFRFNH